MPRKTRKASDPSRVRGRAEKLDLAVRPELHAGSYQQSDPVTQLQRLKAENACLHALLEATTFGPQQYDLETLLQMALKHLPLGGAIVNGEAVDDGEIALLRNDGTPTVIPVSANPIRAQNGKVIAGAAIHHDIAGRKEDNALDESKSAVRALLESAVEAILAFRPDGVITMANAAAERMFGYTREELHHLTLLDLLPVRFRAAHAGLCEPFLDDPHDRLMGMGYQLAAIRKDGTEFPCEVKLSSFQTRPGVQSVAFISDITARREAEDALRASEARYRQLSESVPLMLWSCQPDGSWDYLSGQWLEYTGVPPSQQLGSGWRQTIHPDDREQSSTAWRAAVDTLQDFEATYRIRDAQGAYRWFKFRAKPMRDESGRVLKWLGCCADVDDQKQAEQAVAEKMQALAQSNKMLEQFAYVASHDLREPLRAVAGFVQLLGRRYAGKLGPEADDYINFAAGGARRMQELIDDLLMFSRTGLRERQLAPTDMTEVLEESLRVLQVTIRECQAEIQTDPLPTISGDRVLLVQLLQNLIGNAIKYRKSNEAPRIRFWADQIGDRWVFSIQDNGIGIDPKYHDKIFAIFQRLHTGSEYSGTGIGLAICRNIVDRHQGSIWVESEEGVGSTFRFTLPICEPGCLSAP